MNFSMRSLMRKFRRGLRRAAPRIRGVELTPTTDVQRLESRQLLTGDSFTPRAPAIALATIYGEVAAPAPNPEPAPAPAPNPGDSPFTLTEVIVAIKAPSADALAELGRIVAKANNPDLVSAIDVAASKVLGQVGDATLVQAGLKANASPKLTAAALETSTLVAWASPNFIHQGPDPRELVPNDPLFAQQYHHILMRTSTAWDTTIGSPQIVVAVTDDGVDTTHQDLAANIWSNPNEIAGDGVDNDNNGFVDDTMGWDFSANDRNPNPDGGDQHGTHVSGIVAARINNGLGVAGVAPGVRIMPVRFFGTGAWTSTVIFNSFKYASDNGAQIINTSYNMDGWVGDPTVTAAYDYLYARGVLHLNSAGNNAQLNPARQAFEQTLLVASTDSADRISGFSNYGTGIDLAAPGSGILSTVPGNQYEFFDGTSMSTPAAAGVAALIWSRNPTWTRDQVVAQLLATANNIDGVNPSFAGLLGAGRANSLQGVTATLGAPKFGAVTGLPDEGTLSTKAVNAFQIRIKDFLDPATVVSNVFSMVGDGPDNVFGTFDDVEYALNFNNGSPFRVGTNALNFTISQPLAPDRYEFRAFSGGIKNPFGTPLDGDSDGIGGDDFVRRFEIGFQVTGSIYEDWNGDGARASTDPGFPGIAAYVDLNNNGLLDPVTRASTDVPKTIPTTVSSVSSVLNVTGVPYGVSNVKVALNITHTWVSDLVVRLFAPDGTSVILVNGRGGSGDNLTGTVFDDTAAVAIGAGVAPFAGTFRPEEPLSRLNGIIGNGQWRLQVDDTVDFDGGSLNSWSITFTEPGSTTDVNGNFNFSGLTPGSYNVRIGNLGSAFALTSPTSGFRTINIPTFASTVTGVDFGAVERNAIYGRKFADGNRNGTLDVGERGLGGWTIFQDANNNGAFDQGALTQASTNVPVTISDNTTVSSTLTVSGALAPINDLNVRISINHTWVSDLIITLVSPSGTRVNLVNRRGADGDNFSNTVIDDEAATSITTGVAPFTGSFRPEQPLSALDGANINGVWRLEVSDNATLDTGTIIGWSLIANLAEAFKTTDPNGHYKFNQQVAGPVVIREVNQAGWTATSPAAGFLNVTNVAGQSQYEKNFGAFNPIVVGFDPAGTVIDDGTAQRSLVRTFTFAFNGIVDVATPGALTITRTAGGPPVSFQGVLKQVIIAAGKSKMVFGLSGAGLDGSRGSVSLPDGEYAATLDGSKLFSQSGNTVDVDNDGSAGGTFAVNTFRMFGDSDGDRDVDYSDYLRFRDAFSQIFTTNATAFYDFNGDRRFDRLDMLEFMARYRRRRLV